MKQRNTNTAAILYAVLSIPVLWLALLISSCMAPGRGFFAVLSELTAALNNPLMAKDRWVTKVYNPAPTPSPQLPRTGY